MIHERGLDCYSSKYRSDHYTDEAGCHRNCPQQSLRVNQAQGNSSCARKKGHPEVDL
ncbi:hypothetical protein SAMN05660976_07038 [Nonomuraea pusilla]|uniref:Uncharacterized protein n=1 Tax=Nonomuraea pusilla TaxID=46177 RepID=A0A1H8EMX4_9ACTN|nr:hypothetical protein SAMN05660976_07038 [Nonomuraea pusilla]